MSELLVREAHLTDFNQDERTVSGIAVPWDTPTNVGEYVEQVQRGAIADSGDIKLFSEHKTPIGRVIESEDREDGFWIRAKISDTTAGRDAYTLLKDGVITKFSIGFKPVEQSRSNDGVITRTAIDLKEVSAVSFPAYADAEIQQVRSEGQPQETKDKSMTENVISAADLDEVRASVDELTRSVALMTTNTNEPKGDLTRSAGELLKGITKGDEEITRAYNGAIMTDTIMQDAWIGNLVEILHEKQTVASTFTRGSVPATGMSVEYAVLETDTTQVADHIEGEDLAFGKVSVMTKTASIGTVGGYSSLTRESIERSDVGILDTTWQAIAEKAYRAVELKARAAFNAGVAAADTLTGDITTQDGVIKLILDLAEAYDDLGLSFDGLFLDKASFLALYAVKANDRILQVNGQPADKVGSITVTTASGAVAGVPVKLLPNAAANTVVAYDSSAIKTLESNMPRLQADNVVNLTRDISAYLYVASFVQRPQGLIKVVSA